MIRFSELSDDEINMMTERFVLTERSLQRRIVAKLSADRDNLLEACRLLVELHGVSCVCVACEDGCEATALAEGED